MSISELARRTGLVRQTLSRYARQGMPLNSVEDALSWITNNKPSQEAPDLENSSYPRMDVDGDSSGDRFQRLIDSEKFLAGSIKGIQEETLPELESELEEAATKEEAANARKEIFKANQTLGNLRKQHLSVSKVIADWEHRDAQSKLGRIPFSWVRDTLTASLPPVFAVTRRMRDQEEAKRVVAAFISGIKGVINTLSQEIPDGYAVTEGDNSEMMSEESNCMR